MPRQDDALVVLAECPLFAGADADDIKALADLAAAVSWPAGALVFQRGDPASFLIVVMSGRIRLGLNSLSGRELTLRHGGRGATIGEMGVLDGESRSADATAVTAVRGLMIRRTQFEQLLMQRPGLARTVIHYLTRRLRETTYQLESVALYDLGARLARFLLAALRQVHGDKLPETAVLALELGQSEIAAILGASRPKVNRAFGALIDMGAIIRKGGGLECNTVLLAELAEPDED